MFQKEVVYHGGNSIVKDKIEIPKYSYNTIPYYT